MPLALLRYVDPLLVYDPSSSSYIRAVEHASGTMFLGAYVFWRLTPLLDAILIMPSMRFTHVPSIISVPINLYRPANLCLLVIALTILAAPLVMAALIGVLHYDLDIYFYKLGFKSMDLYVFLPLCLLVYLNVMVVRTAGLILVSILFLRAILDMLYTLSNIGLSGFLIQNWWQLVSYSFFLHLLDWVIYAYSHSLSLLK